MGVLIVCFQVEEKDGVSIVQIKSGANIPWCGEFCLARGLTSSKYNTNIIECVLLMNGVWLHEQGLKREKQIDIHNDL